MGFYRYCASILLLGFGAMIAHGAPQVERPEATVKPLPQGGEALAQWDREQAWLDAFELAPPPSGTSSPAAGETLTLPTFTVSVEGAGPELVRCAVPIPYRALHRDEPVSIRTPAGTSIAPQSRILSVHGGPVAFVRRMLVSFVYDFPSAGVYEFAVSRETPAQPLHDVSTPLQSMIVNVRENGYEMLQVAGDAATPTPYLQSFYLGPQRDSVTDTRLEVIEEGPYYLWLRQLQGCSRYPRILELQVDAFGGVLFQVHLQQTEEGFGVAPDFGARVLLGTGEGGEETEHRFDGEGLPEALTMPLHPGAWKWAAPQASWLGTGAVLLTDRHITYRPAHGSKLPHQEGAWRRAAVAINAQDHQPDIFSAFAGRSRFNEATMAFGLGARVNTASYLALYPFAPQSDLSPWPQLVATTAFHRDAIATAHTGGLDHGNIGGMNRLNHCPPIFHEYYRSGEHRLREGALRWTENFHDLSIWWDPNFGDTFGGTRYNNRAAMGDDFAADPDFMWRSNTAVHFCTKGYDSFLYAWEETGDPRYAAALRHQVSYARDYVHADQGEARNVGDVLDFVMLYEMTGIEDYLLQGRRLFEELRSKTGEDGLFSQSGAPIVPDRPFIDDDAMGSKHPFPKPYILGYALAGLPRLAAHAPDMDRLTEIIESVARFMATHVDPAGGWRYPDVDSSAVFTGQGIEHAAQLCRAIEWLSAQGKDVNPLLDAVEVVLQARILAYLQTGAFFGSISAWERETGLLVAGASLHDRYATADERDKSRDYIEGGVHLGPTMSPEGMVYFTEVLSTYLTHRPAERLLQANEALAQVLARMPESGPSLPSREVPHADYGVEQGLPTYAEERIASMPFPLALRHQGDLPLDEARYLARQALLETLGEAPPRTSFNAEVLAEELREGYVARKVQFNLSAHYRVPAYVLIPEGNGPFPAVLALHDHGAHFSIGKEKVVRPFAVDPAVEEDATAWVNKYYGGTFIGDALAARGYVVLAVDAIYWGERGSREGAGYEGQQAFAANLLQLGLNWLGHVSWDDLRSLDFLLAQPEVDPGRIAAVGLSMGAHRTWMLNALTDRVHVGVAICWMGDTPSLISLGNNQTRGQSAFSMTAPGLRNVLDFPDVAALAAPKPMLFYNGTADGLFPIPGVDRSYAILRAAWESAKASDKLVTQWWEVPHEFNAEMQAEAFTWLDAQLQP